MSAEPRGDRREYTEIGPLLTDVYFICPDCGCLVVRRGVHDRWHDDEDSDSEDFDDAPPWLEGSAIDPRDYWKSRRRRRADQEEAGVVDRLAYAIFHVGPPPLAPCMSWDQARRMAAAAVKVLANEEAT